jgi:hypothetical protein
VSQPKPLTLIARITEYDSSNVHLGGKIIFIPQERRETVRTEHPPGKIVKIISENGTLKDIDRARGDDLDKFLKEEEAARSGRSTTAAEKIRKGIPTKEKPMLIDKSPETRSPESYIIEMPLNSKISIDPTVINDSFRQLSPPLSETLQCGHSGPCISARCRKLVSCWTAEINAMRGLGMHSAADVLEKQLKQILGA